MDLDLFEQASMVHTLKVLMHFRLKKNTFILKIYENSSKLYLKSGG